MTGQNIKDGASIVNFGCPVTKTADMVGGKWKGVILYHLTSGSKRYNELRKLLPHITQRMLTLQLRELERDGIVLRQVYPVVPPRVDYSLTALGETLRPVLFFMRDWGVYYENLQENGESQVALPELDETVIEKK
ncbi:transcriptional regulator, HxlR family [Paenibacillus algorifonticola]|uniref:Transcriptional regulator, HxlR family n=1 Tax=Paenibacillus algorifonticola TaxID=684063 RepID=A0A1I2FQ22_9BACL|nr:helix-turn-helix domain-containing protein [Paenibacillus algorifonticola]SFF07415.1 transcriptional regulator, HxlR family [Paenibacillus algorifonticola]